MKWWNNFNSHFIKLYLRWFLMRWVVIGTFHVLTKCKILSMKLIFHFFDVVEFDAATTSLWDIVKTDEIEKEKKRKEKETEKKQKSLVFPKSRGNRDGLFFVVTLPVNWENGNKIEKEKINCSSWKKKIKKMEKNRKRKNKLFKLNAL
jgi:hypothetical protein